MENFKINIRDDGRCYYYDEVTCYEKPVVVLLDYVQNDFGKLFLIICKALRLYNYENNMDTKHAVVEFVKKYLGISFFEKNNEKNIVEYLINELRNNNAVLISGNQYEIPYSELHYKKDDCGHLFLIKGYNSLTKMFTIFDNLHLSTSEYEDKDKRYSDFFLSEDDIKRVYNSYIEAYGETEAIILLRKNENFGKYSKTEILMAAIQMLCNEKIGERFWQIEKLKELDRMVNVEQADKKRIIALSKKILNYNKYKNVLFNEIKMFMKQYGYSIEKIREVDILKEEMYSLWMDFVTISIAKIKRNVEWQVSDDIVNKENEFVDALASFLAYLKKDIGKIDENRKSDIVHKEESIISSTESTVVFEFTDGKTYNYWIDDYAPKFVLRSGIHDKTFKVSATVDIDTRSLEEKYQAGIYATNSEGKTYFAAIEATGKVVLDTIGENNFSDSFIIPNTYNIEVKIVDDDMHVKYSINETTKEMKMRIGRGEYLDVGLMVKTWGNGQYLRVKFEDININ